jgi:hypothetical protein
LETAIQSFLDQVEFADAQEMAAIRSDKTLLRSLKTGSADIKKGRFKMIQRRLV